MNAKMIEKLLEWYDCNKRVLPWRIKKDPYEIWVSEIMLQQTRVETVIPYFKNFIYKVPNIVSLANIYDDELLKLWEGLGYYSRVKNMKKCAQLLMEKYNGKMPQKYEELIKLPGIGFYTAGAIASMAYNEKTPAIDGNVMRILTRVNLDYSDVSKDKVKKEYFEKLKEFIGCRPGDCNQAFMDLGANICVPNGKPKCDICPLKKECLAFQKKKIDEIPIKRKKIQRKIEEKTVILYRYKNEIALLKRPEVGLLASLYEYPNIDGHFCENEFENYLKNEKIPFLNIKKIENSKHLFSHIEWKMIAYEVYLEKKIPSYLWINVTNLFEYTIPTAFKTYTSYIKEKNLH